jgi:septum formation protein
MNTLKHLMSDRVLIVASASPRRHLLIDGLDIPYRVEVSGDIDESFDLIVPVKDVPLLLANKKADFFGRELVDGEILLTADTMVLCDGKIMGKPENEADALKMLSFLSDKMHTVITGVVLRSNKGAAMFSAETRVFFKKLSNEEMQYYINNYKPYDKAGSYGAQEWIGYIAIEKIEGSYFNVMGLPIQKLYKELIAFIDGGY